MPCNNPRPGTGKCLHFAPGLGKKTIPPLTYKYTRNPKPRLAIKTTKPLLSNDPSDPSNSPKDLWEYALMRVTEIIFAANVGQSTARVFLMFLLIWQRFVLSGVLKQIEECFSKTHSVHFNPFQDNHISVFIGIYGIFLTIF